MKQAVEVVHLVGGSPVSTTMLSLRRERWAAAGAFGAVWLGYAAALVMFALLAQRFGRVMFLPALVGIWFLVAAVVSVWAARRAVRRARRFTLGTRLDADAFAETEVDLIRRGPTAFELGLVPGMTGELSAGRAALPVEAFVSDGTRMFTLTGGASARLTLGTSTFVVRCRKVDASASASLFTMVREALRPSATLVAMGMQVALGASLLCLFPGGAVIDGRVQRASGFRASTPWEAEKWLRIEAQSQALSLHQCFDSLPVACQRPGFLGVGVALNREGEIRSNWIARSTYGADCPVDRCVSEMVSTWTFDPLPESMRVVLPVQVLRTNRPLPVPSSKTACKAGSGADSPNPSGTVEAPASLAALEWTGDGI